eukprot:CAMPEP_0203667316 /NCGR_PEP_ID=MMETSP0090-20130426/4172_1 /ASSEMBLY_ACC=CAM_ASM_001088 /TAXON_ID=426623 /ORGANISM="Chaetoceros affinis, Strain CCMP159" /LENGTH=365 /DNA_ID=CAMNT_0050531437 /DNA_START=120 /DNA_END=1217 /DNA_ORIENTATION=-
MKRRVINKSDQLDDVGTIVSVSRHSATASTTSNKKNSSSKVMLPIFLIIIGCLVGFIVYQEQHHEELKTELVDKIRKEAKATYENKEKEIVNNYKASEEDLKNNEMDLTVRLNDMVDKIESLELELKESDKKRKKAKGELEKKEKDTKVNDLVTQQIEHLRQEIQRHDKHAVLEKFGEGPHRLEFKLDFPPDEVPEGTADTFVIEMAPIDLMPHTVHFFLEQASRGLLDGCSFHRNAGHVVQGGPVSNHLNPGVNVRKPFADADLMSVSFQEYHADFPHVKYTLGYAGRPGGPDFYVSTRDNTRNHGPGGQTSYALASEADPCFAKVVKGFDAVDRMQKMSVQPGGYKRMTHYIAIKSVKILNEE